MTCAGDCRARLWTLDGQFVGTFGQPTPWSQTDRATWQRCAVPQEIRDSEQAILAEHEEAMRAEALATLPAHRRPAPAWGFVDEFSSDDVPEEGVASSESDVLSGATSPRSDSPETAVSPKTSDVSLNIVDSDSITNLTGAIARMSVTFAPKLMLCARCPACFSTGHCFLRSLDGPVRIPAPAGQRREVLRYGGSGLRVFLADRPCCSSQIIAGTTCVTSTAPFGQRRRAPVRNTVLQATRFVE